MRIWIVFALGLFSFIFFYAGKQPAAPVVSTAPVPHAKKTSAMSKSVFRKPADTNSLSAKPNLDPLNLQLKKLADLKSCYETRKCKLDDSDPRAYEIELGKMIQGELANLRMKFSRNPTAQSDILKTAKEFMLIGDGFVQEEVMKILSGLPPSEESLTAITEGLQFTPDPTLMDQALKEFKRYMGTSMEKNVHSFLSTTIATGAQFSSLTVSEKIQPFLNSQSYPIYQQALTKMTPGARAAKNLNAALREYRRLQTGA